VLSVLVPEDRASSGSAIRANPANSLRRTELFREAEQSASVHIIGEQNRTKNRNVSHFVGNFCRNLRVVGEFQVRFTGFH
jgi:hypothetical protein